LFKKAAVFTDIHFGLKGNSRVHNDDCEEFVDWFIETAKANGCETGIFCGDWHHNRNSLNLATMDATMRSMEKLGAAFEKFYLFLGNHDLYYKDRRDVASTMFGKHIPGVAFVDKIIIEDDVALVPWLVGDEWKQMEKIKTKYIFGHFELPSFYMNAMVQMPDHGDLKAEHFKNQEYVFSGHFHKRQKQGKIHYIGNAFPHNYADVDDDDRGMMILDRENNLEPQYINWSQCPKYRTVTLSKLIDSADTFIKDKMYLRVTLDLPISYEEASFIKETFIGQYNCREITLIPQKQLEEINTDLDITQFESVDQIVSNEIALLDTNNYNKNVLLEIYNGLEQKHDSN
jgi:DNA repair exonuclease SbcCD nuclease subunit